MNTRQENFLKELNIKNLKAVKKKIHDIKQEKWFNISFIIDGIPKQTERPRVGFYKNLYVPNAAKNKKDIKKQIEKQIDLKNFEIIKGEVYVKVTFYMPIPKAFSKTDKFIAELGYIKSIVKPDIDNLLKTILDGITHTGLWLDDDQVVRIVCEKRYSNEPRTEVKLKYKQEISCSVLKTYNKNKLENSLKE